ncbi:hypothetical protein PDUR_10510 [Paenibacillus durus]|uniref:Lipoprotein n=1 Tax=Paenibacillus durus TaxID=44251 RepID=A0A089HPJ2_PAEDU|nr:hypothetical protein PDUR_10510 [Paenibacillus durus]
MKKEIGILVLMSAVLFSGCGSDRGSGSTQGASESPSNQVTAQPEQETHAKLIEASENEKVKLYAIKETKNVIEGVTLDIDGSQKDFDWEIADTGTKPQVFYTDLTGDGKEEAVITINTGRGTDLNTYDIHVINAGDLSEIKVQNYKETVADQIETHVTKNEDGNLAIKVKAQGKYYEFSYAADPGLEVQDKLNFGGTVIYELENQKIISRIGGSVGTSPIYVCGFHITYKFDSSKNEFIADQIKVEP